MNNKFYYLHLCEVSALKSLSRPIELQINAAITQLEKNILKQGSTHDYGGAQFTAALLAEHFLFLASQYTPEDSMKQKYEKISFIILYGMNKLLRPMENPIKAAKEKAKHLKAETINLEPLLEEFRKSISHTIVLEDITRRSLEITRERRSAALTESYRHQRESESSQTAQTSQVEPADTGCFGWRCKPSAP